MTRNPFALTLSAYHFMKNKKRKLYECSLEDIIHQEWDSNLHIYSGFGKHVFDWMEKNKNLDKNNIYFLTYEQLRMETERSVEELIQFLGITFREAKIERQNSKHRPG